MKSKNIMLKSKFLRSRVARRIFALFVACALGPMAVLTGLSFLQVSDQLQTQNRRELEQGAKSVGQAVYERLTILDSELQVISLRIRQGDPMPPLIDGSHFQAVTLRKDQSNQAVAIKAAATITAAERTHLLSGKPVIHLDSCSMNKGTTCVVIMKMIDPHDLASGMIMGEVNSSYLWSADRLPAYINLSVINSKNGILYNSDPGKISAAMMPVQHDPSGFFQWRGQGKVYDAAYRDLFLRAGFLADTWTIILSQDHQNAFAPIQRFRNTFLLVTLLAIWIVVLSSLIQIRRTMVPLEKLSAGMARIVEQNFAGRVEIASGDEFQDLAASFNSMSGRLGKQFQTLRAINDIDQAILSSLNRDSVVHTALSRMENLLPCDCFAIAIFRPAASQSASVQMTIRELHSDSQKTYTDRTAGANDLQQLQQDRSMQIMLGCDSTPEYLLPLRDLGMTSVFAFPVLLDNRVFAALLCGHSKSAPMTLEDTQHARQVADQLAVAFSNVQLVEALEQLHWGTITALARAIDAKSTWTAGHSERVTQLALKIGNAMGLSSREIQTMHLGGLLHDIGKIGTAPGILDKPGKLDPEEMRLMRDHVRIGVRILEPIAAFTDALPIVAQHHEWFNGGGYPAGLAGEEITLPARIFAVADCYDAMVSDRPYRKGLPQTQVVNMLKEKSGIQFDPKVIEVFMRLFEKDEIIHVSEDEARLVGQSL
ncbi:MAG TPA: HD domain-containing phosphohydrolase [Terriglobales bacterium]|nr:HD domain-containing phosphohydrolase [Terriglobales bacterium]